MKYEYAVKPICFYVGRMEKNGSVVFKLGLFHYNFLYNVGEMTWFKEEFEYRRDCILSILPNNQGIPLITSEASFVNILDKHDIIDYVDVQEVITPKS